MTVRHVRHSSSGVRWWPHRVVVVSHRTMSRSEAVCCGLLPAADVTSMEKGKKSPAFHFINSELSGDLSRLGDGDESEGIFWRKELTPQNYPYYIGFLIGNSHHHHITISILIPTFSLLIC